MFGSCGPRINYEHIAQLIALTTVTIPDNCIEALLPYKVLNEQELGPMSLNMACDTMALLVSHALRECLQKSNCSTQVEYAKTEKDILKPILDLGINQPEFRVYCGMAMEEGFDELVSCFYRCTLNAWSQTSAWGDTAAKLQRYSQTFSLVIPQQMTIDFSIYTYLFRLATWMGLIGGQDRRLAVASVLVLNAKATAELTEYAAGLDCLVNK